MNKKVKQKLVLSFVTILSRPLLFLYKSSLSVHIFNRRYVRQCIRNGEHLLYTFWHENMILPLLVHENQGIYVLVSHHFDGEVIARILRIFGYHTIRGSSTRGGKEAYNEMKKRLAESQMKIAFTPDGPRGPRREAKLGIIRLASETGAPIIPMAVAADRFTRLKSWDKLLIFHPFSRCTLVYHKPFYVPSGLNQQQLSEYGKKLSQITSKLDEEAIKCLPG
ncbi:MAG: DUF374 domain-containing protein [Calditrichaeota bacterium]|nr:lysophospholipid acyltransferase family protein [Calditrichota bacterium]RQW05974.1 MAG: DUF374 domain-containing protein [Calditrichota bacterium]